MPPPMLPTRPWPQTLLLTALTLLIAAATIMLACGPVAQPIPEEGDTRAAVLPVAETEEPTPTPTPERDCAQSVHIPGGEICGPPIPTKPPLKYPKLRSLNSVAVVAEAEAAAAGISSQSDAEVRTVYARIALADKASVDAVLAWLESKRIPSVQDWNEGDVGFVRSHGDDYIYAVLPALLLIPLSRQEGVLYLDDGCRTSYC